MKRTILLTLLTIITVICSSCRPDKLTSLPIDNNDSIIDNHNYAPLQVGNEWTYVRHVEYHVNSGFLTGGIDSYEHQQFLRDTIHIRVVHKTSDMGITSVVLTVDQVIFDSTIYHLGGADSTVKSLSLKLYDDTLTIVRDSICPPRVLDYYGPFFRLLDHPDNCKKVVIFKNKKLFLATYFTAFYLDTYGLIKTEYSHSGNGYSINKNVRLISFKGETIDSAEIESIVK